MEESVPQAVTAAGAGDTAAANFGFWRAPRPNSSELPRGRAVPAAGAGATAAASPRSAIQSDAARHNFGFWRVPPWKIISALGVFRP